MSKALTNPIYVSILRTMQDLDELGGVNSTEEYIQIMDNLRAEITRRSNAARKTLQNVLTSKTRDEIVEFLAECKMNSCFGDGAENDYIREGTEFIGLYEMTDAELVEELLSYTGENEDIYQQAKGELILEAVLKGEEG
jgi:hypothetical protein